MNTFWNFLLVNPFLHSLLLILVNAVCLYWCMGAPRYNSFKYEKRIFKYRSAAREQNPIFGFLSVCWAIGIVFTFLMSLSINFGSPLGSVKNVISVSTLHLIGLFLTIIFTPVAFWFNGILNEEFKKEENDKNWGAKTRKYQTLGE